MTTHGLQQHLHNLRRAREKTARYQSHISFLSTCLQKQAIPPGMRIRFGKDALPKSDFLHNYVQDLLRSVSIDIIHQCKLTYVSLLTQEMNQIHSSLHEIFKCVSYFEFETILEHHNKSLKSYQKFLKIKKNKKLHKLSACTSGKRFTRTHKDGTQSGGNTTLPVRPGGHGIDTKCTVNLAFYCNG